MPKHNPTHKCHVCGTLYWGRKRYACSTACGYESKFLRFISSVETRAGQPLEPLIRKRLDEGQAMRAITKELGISDSRHLGKIMDRLGIPRPTRSEAVAKQWAIAPARRIKQAAAMAEWMRSDPERARANSIKANLILQTTSPTSIERALMVALDKAGIAYQFQYVVGGKFLCDFAFPESMLIVETDGSYWHRTPRQKSRGASKDAYLRACGFNVLRLTDVQVTQHLTGSLAAIQALLRQ